METSRTFTELVSPVAPRYAALGNGAMFVSWVTFAAFWSGVEMPSSVCFNLRR